jgi:hypothetical protein
VIGKDIHGSSLEEQMAFVNAELNGSEKVAGDALRGCITARDAGAYVSTLYERPADKEGEAARRGALAESILAQSGAPESPVSAPAAPEVSAPQPQPAKAPMPLLALLPLIAQFVPQIMTLIKPNSVSTAKDAAVAGTILDTVVKAAGVLNPDGTPAPVNATTVGQAADKMAADPALAKSVQQAVVTHPDILPMLQVSEIGQGGITAARTANVIAPDAKWWSGFVAPVFIFGLILCGMVIMVLGNVLGMPWGGAFQDWSSEVRASVISAVITGGLGAITGYWFGTTVASNRKDAVIAQAAGIPAPVEK